jgi:hypothetical protein
VTRLAAWWRQLAARHPRLYAYRHVAAAVGSALLAIVGVAVFMKTLAAEVLDVLFGWLPGLRLPDIDIPDLPLPSIPFPHITMPDWFDSMTGVAKYVVPVLIAVAIAHTEIKRRANDNDDEDHDAKG